MWGPKKYIEDSTTFPQENSETVEMTVNPIYIHIVQFYKNQYE